jgi:predicted Zn-dependent protease with MMP-like domain
MTSLSREEFENLAQEIFDSLPEQFQRNMENVHIVVEDVPSDETLTKMHISSSRLLLGLYEGVPLNKRGTWYGMYPVVPDKISLYKSNIESVARTLEELRGQIRTTLIHEIAHY